MSPYKQGSQLQSPALICNISKKAIKYLEWEAPMLTKNTSTSAQVMGSADIWQPYKPALEKDTTANQRIRDSGQSFYFCQLLGSWVQVPTLIRAGQEERSSFLFFPPSFWVWLEMGPGDVDLLGKASPLISLVNCESLWLKPHSPVHPN